MKKVIFLTVSCKSGLNDLDGRYGDLYDANTS